MCVAGYLLTCGFRASPFLLFFFIPFSDRGFSNREIMCWCWAFFGLERGGGAGAHDDSRHPPFYQRCAFPDGENKTLKPP